MEHKVKWIDVLKGLLVIVIFLGCVRSENITYDFLFTHHVELFFCVFGLIECLDKENNILKYIIEKVKTVLVPSFVIAYMVLIIVTIQYNCGLDTVKEINASILKGMIRGTFVADSLWYITCLFSIQVLFFVIKKVKYRWLIFMISLGIHCANVLWMNAIEYPHWYLNLDCALYYIIFYAGGYLMFPHVKSLFEMDTWKKKAFFTITGGISFAYSVAVYCGVDVLLYVFPSAAWRLETFVRACIIIWLYLVGAKILQDVKYLSDIGKNVLYLCGSEYILRILITTMMSITGKSFVIYYPIHIFMYIGIAIFIGNKYLVPVERYLIGKVVREV